MTQITNLRRVTSRSTERLGITIVAVPRGTPEVEVHRNLAKFIQGELIGVGFSSYTLMVDGKRRNVLWGDHEFYEVTTNAPPVEPVFPMPGEDTAFDTYDMDLGVKAGRAAVVAMPGHPGMRSPADIADTAAKAAVFIERKRLAERLRDRLLYNDISESDIPEHLRMAAQEWIYSIADQIEKGLPIKQQGSTDE